jgi:hypothetical protein
MKPLFLILLLTGLICAQSPDRWRGFVLDPSTPDEATNTLGKPKKDLSTNNSESFEG